MDKILTSVLEVIAQEEEVEIAEVEKILKLPYRQMRHHIMKLDLYGKTSEEVGDIKSNFNMPALFKLYLNKLKLDKLNKKENG